MYRILCDRMPARELGSGLTWFMQDGRVVEFATTEEAGVMVKVRIPMKSAPIAKQSGT